MALNILFLVKTIWVFNFYGLFKLFLLSSLYLSQIKSYFFNSHCITKLYFKICKFIKKILVAQSLSVLKRVSNNE